MNYYVSSNICMCVCMRVCMYIMKQRHGKEIFLDCMTFFESIKHVNTSDKVVYMRVVLLDSASFFDTYDVTCHDARFDILLRHNIDLGKTNRADG